MSQQNMDVRIKPFVFILVFILLWAIAMPFIRWIKPATPQIIEIHEAPPETKTIAEPNDAKQQIQNNEIQKINLNDIIRVARTWGPAFISWRGQTATDFTLADLNGKEHKLSDYNGKNVLIVFWATWCRPCLAEIPHLIALRNTVSEDELAILAISNEPADLLKRFVGKSRINYTVLSSSRIALPAPFDRVTSIPTTFFIDSNGKIKLAASGMISLGELKAILRAK